jgi:hypothetical protein
MNPRPGKLRAVPRVSVAQVCAEPYSFSCNASVPYSWIGRNVLAVSTAMVARAAILLFMLPPPSESRQLSIRGQFVPTSSR